MEPLKLVEHELWLFSTKKEYEGLVGLISLFRSTIFCMMELLRINCFILSFEILHNHYTVESDWNQVSVVHYPIVKNLPITIDVKMLIHTVFITVKENLRSREF